MFMICVFTVLFASFRLLLLLASVSFRSCEDSLDYVAPSTSWIHSSPLWIPRQDDHTLGYLYYHCLCLVVSMLSLYVALPIFIVSPSPCCHETSNLWHLPSKNHCLAMLPACSAPLIALLVAGEDEDHSMLELVVGISQYLLLLLTHLYTSHGWKAWPFARCFVPLMPP